MKKPVDNARARYSGGPPVEDDWIYGDFRRADVEMISGLPFAKDYGSFQPYGLIRKRVNAFAFVVAVLFPPAIFAVMCTLMSFELYVRHPWFVYFALGCCLALPVIFALRYYHVRNSEKTDGEAHEPSWLLFMAVSSTVAALAGLGIGALNYEINTKHHYDYLDLAQYSEVDPSAAGGRAYMDAGSIRFVNGSRLDVARSVGYREEHTYCVAPITFGDKPLASYDFWAVGIDCCSGFPGGFGCFDNARYLSVEPVHSGRRWLRPENAREKFLAAMQQSQAEFGFITQHPVFLVWEQDPQRYIRVKKDDGIKLDVFACLTALLTQLVTASYLASGRPGLKSLT